MRIIAKAKPIRIRIKSGGEEHSSLDSLRQNLCVQDLWSLVKDKRLSRWLMQLGEVVFGGVGSGLYGMLVFALLAVFVAGLMVGRTPEYLGKKIEAFEMKMVALVILVTPMLVLLGAALAVVSSAGLAGLVYGGTAWLLVLMTVAAALAWGLSLAARKS